MRWVLTPFLRYADFKGRSGRAEFWTFLGVSAGMIVFVMLLTGLSSDTANTEKLAPPAPPGANASPVGAIIYVVWWLTSIVPWVAVQVRRFHDQGRSGWLAFIGIPDDVSRTDDGQYSCRGYVFNSRSAAVSYSQRLHVQFTRTGADLRKASERPQWECRAIRFSVLFRSGSQAPATSPTESRAVRLSWIWFVS